jgi:hypothetical protein
VIFAFKDSSLLANPLAALTLQPSLKISKALFQCNIGVFG